MIDSFDRVVIGAPGGLAIWMFGIIRDLAKRHRAGKIDVALVDRLDRIGARPADTVGRVLLTHFPNPQIIDALTTLDSPVLYLEETAHLVVDHLVRRAGHAPIEAIRVCSAAYVANRSLGGVPRLAVLSRDTSDSLHQVLLDLSAHLELDVAERDLCAYAVHIAPPDVAPGQAVDAAVARFASGLHSNAATDAPDLSPEVSNLVTAILEPCRYWARMSVDRAILWPGRIFYHPEHPTEHVPRIIDHVVEYTTAAIRQNQCGRASFSNDLRTVNGQDHRAVLAFVEQLVNALVLKTQIPNQDDFIDQETFKINREREREGQAHAHAAGIEPDWNVKLLADFGEIFDEIEGILERDAVNARDKTDIIVAGQFSLEAATERERPRHPEPARYAAVRWALKAGQNLNESGLAGAIATEHCHPFARPHTKRYAIKDTARADLGMKLLYNPIGCNRSVGRRFHHARQPNAVPYADCRDKTQHSRRGIYCPTCERVSIVT